MYLFSYLLCRFSGLVLAIINCNSVNIVNSCKNVVIWGFAISIYCKYLYNLMENMGIHLHAIHANKFFSCFMICLICVKWQHSDGLGITTIYFSGLKTRWTSSCHQGDVLFCQNDALQFFSRNVVFWSAVISREPRKHTCTPLVRVNFGVAFTTLYWYRRGQNVLSWRRCKIRSGWDLLFILLNWVLLFPSPPPTR